jgi:hypothetical protein
MESGAMRPTVFGEPSLTRVSRYRYRCGACNRCCQNYRIQVNPYEILRLARYLGLSTTAFIARYLEQGPYLPHRKDGACSFLGPSGCTVHSARPLVCRLYPLGRHISAAGEERFSHLRPHPETEGEYGDDGTVEDYLQSQGALPYIAAADRYFALFHRLLSVFQQDAPVADAETAETLRAHAGLGSRPLPDLLDPDRTVARHTVDSQPGSLDPETAMALHLDAVDSWLTSISTEHDNEKEIDPPA